MLQAVIQDTVVVFSQFETFTIFCDVTTCSAVNFNRYFGGAYLLHFQGPKISEAGNKHEADSKQSSAEQVTSCLLLVGNLSGLPFDYSQNGNSAFLRELLLPTLHHTPEDNTSSQSRLSELQILKIDLYSDL
jgi:hypothetical protein